MCGKATAVKGANIQVSHRQASLVERSTFSGLPSIKNQHLTQCRDESQAPKGPVQHVMWAGRLSSVHALWPCMAAGHATL